MSKKYKRPHPPQSRSGFVHCIFPISAGELFLSASRRLGVSFPPAPCPGLPDVCSAVRSETAASCRAVGIVRGELQACEAASVPDGPASGAKLSFELHFKK